jgi:hypothetical protein
MDETKRQLLEWIDADRDRLITFLSRFVQAKTPNPPGDTREAAAYLTEFLDAAELPYCIIDPKPEFPNIVGTFARSRLASARRSHSSSSTTSTRRDVGVEGLKATGNPDTKGPTEGDVIWRKSRRRHARKAAGKHVRS